MQLYQILQRLNRSDNSYTIEREFWKTCEFIYQVFFLHSSSLGQKEQGDIAQKIYGAKAISFF